MQTFSDEEKCKTFTEKTYSGKPEEGEIHLSPEEEESLYIRSDLKTEMFGKNTLYLKSKLGDPEDKINLGAGKEVLIYKRPISKYAKGSKPDKQISFVIKRNRIVQIKHIAPN
ncbi:MAG: hypothetical protein H7A24_15605 [Leptospiraceae bacterium]|nr:hypothetical protein [Leptospiraceae bacterium]MCP5513312.1 hypothetical protein [Leptospiraceae bacterium]